MNSLLLQIMEIMDMETIKYSSFFSFKIIIPFLNRIMKHKNIKKKILPLQQDFQQLSSSSQNKLIQSLSSFFPSFPKNDQYLFDRFQSLYQSQKYNIYIEPSSSHSQLSQIFTKYHLPSTFTTFVSEHLVSKTIPFSQKETMHDFCSMKLFIEDIDLIDHYRNIVVLTDSFQYQERLKCKLLSQQQEPLHFIQQNLPQLYRKYFEHVHKVYETGIPLPNLHIDSILQKIDSNTFSEEDFQQIIHPLLFQYLLEEEKIKLCTLYKSYLMKLWIQIFDAKYILDLSSGWGDRLLGALALQNSIEKYIGIDPNENLQKGYHEMINAFCLPKNRSKFELLVEPSQNVNYEQRNETFDLIFWSPPFFDLETYVPNKKNKSYQKQSIQSFQTYEEWEDHFIVQTLQKSCLKLKRYGIFVFYIGFVKETLFQKIGEIPNLKYLGDIYVSSYRKNKAASYMIYQKV